MNLYSLFTRHPASVGESYRQHLTVASYFSFNLLVAGAACFVHAILPFCFERTASTIIRRLHGRMILNRHRQATVAYTETEYVL